MPCQKNDPPLGSIIRYLNGYNGTRVRIREDWWQNPNVEDNTGGGRNHYDMMQMIRTGDAQIIQWGA